MRDRDVRESVWCWLEAEHEYDQETLMLDELGILNGATRIDIAVIDGQIAGYELKSARDTLDRLPAQRDLYNKVLDRITLVVAENHLKDALAIIPDWWGLAIASSTSSGVSITRERMSEMNPCLDAATIASFLWRDEALAVLDRYGAARGVSGKPRAALYERIAIALDIDVVRAEVRTAMKGRARWRTDRRSQPKVLSCSACTS
jgi:hypothetical protein